MLIRHHFPVHIMYKHIQNTHLCTALGCTVHHLACTGTYKNGKCLHSHIWVVEYRASENVFKTGSPLCVLSIFFLITDILSTCPLGSS